MKQEIDIAGLPIFYVNKFVSTTLENGDVMLVCGLKCGLEFTPLYVTITPNSTAMTDGRRYLDAAEEAFNNLQMVDGTAH